MIKNRTSSRSSLFLIEMIFSVLILSLCASACVRIYAVSWQNRREAREWNHVQELLTNTSEILEATDGSPETFLTYMPYGTADNGRILCYYTSDWVAADPEHAFYRMTLTPETSGFRKAVHFCISRTDTGERTLYETEIAYPLFPFSEKEAADEKAE